MWLIRLRKIDKPKIFQIFPPFCVLNYSENYPQNFFPKKIVPWENYPQWNALPTYKSYKWKKKQNYKSFCLEESCAIQYPYQNNQGPLWYTDDLTENTGLRYFLYRMKKNPKIDRKRKSPSGIYLLASCTSQGELNLGSQIIKFGNMWKY